MLPTTQRWSKEGLGILSRGFSISLPTWAPRRARQDGCRQQLYPGQRKRPKTGPLTELQARGEGSGSDKIKSIPILTQGGYGEGGVM
jgi:hypothetical protein